MSKNKKESTKNLFLIFGVTFIVIFGGYVVYSMGWIERLNNGISNVLNPDKMSYELAVAKSSVTGYEEYLQEYPNGNYVEEAKNAIKNMFYLHENGFTVVCDDAKIGDKGTVNGKIYTKRSRDQITVDNASTTCTSGITNMSQLFYYSQYDPSPNSKKVNQTFNGDIHTWDLSDVINSRMMFSGATQFNGNIGGWDVSNITNMWGMFWDAKSFNADIRAWDVSNVSNMSWMFNGASQFNRDIGEWDVSNVIDMSEMFSGASKFNKDISSWNVSNVTNMYGLFNGAVRFNQNLSKWCTKSVNFQRDFGMIKGSPPNWSSPSCE